jgi:hypothetical protein
LETAATAAGIAAINEACKLLPRSLPRRAFAKKSAPGMLSKSLILLVGGDGFEPPTLSV